MRCRPLFVAAWLCSLATSALALAPGLRDDFQTGVQGWSSGPANPTPPLVVASGGPAGAGDSFLRAASSGGAGAGGKLVVFSGPQWAGDYGAAGITAITLELANMGGTDLALRLLFDGPGGATAITSQVVSLRASSGWQAARFDITPALLLGASAAAVLAGVSQFRLYNGPDAVYPGPLSASLLGIDNVTAVPEPAAAWLLGAGVALLSVRRRTAR